MIIFETFSTLLVYDLIIYFESRSCFSIVCLAVAGAVVDALSPRHAKMSAYQGLASLAPRSNATSSVSAAAADGTAPVRDNAAPDATKKRGPRGGSGSFMPPPPPKVDSVKSKVK